MDLKEVPAKVLEAVIARLVADGIEAAMKNALRPKSSPKHLR